MPALSTRPSSITSPVRISRAALSTEAGVMWLAEPRSSPAPHFDGQRSLSAGGFQVWAPAIVDTNTRATANVPACACEALHRLLRSRGWLRWVGRDPVEACAGMWPDTRLSPHRRPRDCHTRPGNTEADRTCIPDRRPGTCGRQRSRHGRRRVCVEPPVGPLSPTGGSCQPFHHRRP